MHCMYVCIESTEFLLFKMQTTYIVFEFSFYMENKGFHKLYKKI